ncbi:MAG: hypothetical protein JEZ06_02875 [Anaerolineaceae bacterium]|nr:hypothetical protein [Anaerolineaceae bacterium]
MTIYQNQYWGYELLVPDGWFQNHHSENDTNSFSPNKPETENTKEEEEEEEEEISQLLIRCEWMFPPRPIEPIWRQHIGLTAGVMGAKNVGSAPWVHANSEGFETEIILPKRSNTRLWAGILAKNFMVMKFMLTHPRKDHDWLQPIATELIKSIWFPEKMDHVEQTPAGIPLPSNWIQTDPSKWVPDIQDLGKWSAYIGAANIGMLQYFYVREVIAYGWKIIDFSAFPGNANLGFSKLRIEKAGQTATIGILPAEEENISVQSPAVIVIKFE